MMNPTASHVPAAAPGNRSCSIVLGLAALLLAGSTPANAATQRPPNIVFILADDMGYDAGCYGRPDVHTPAIDQLAARGVRFTQAYAASPVCTAARTALITGRYPERLRVGLEEPLAGRRGDPGLPPDHPTLPSLLRKVGYHTLLIGKWHLGTLPNYGPLQSGYEHFYGFRQGAADYFRHGAGPRDDFWADDEPIHEDGYFTDLFGQRAVDAIDAFAKSDAPFLISLHFNAPHWPWEGPKDAAESQRLMKDHRPLFDLDGGSQATYVAMLEEMDRQIGRVLAALEAHGLADNTIVVFTSDNGGERFAYRWPFTGLKTELLEGGLRVPAIICWPARVPAGVSSDQVMITMDWLPTLLAAAGTTPDSHYPTDGLNLLPLLTSHASPVPRRLFWRYKANAQQAVRDGDWKYLKIRDATFLFNVAADPLERANRRERDAARYRQLVREWFAWEVTMLPLTDASYTHAFSGHELADHIGTPEPSQKAEPVTSPKWLDDDATPTK